MLLKLARIAEADRIARRIYSTDVRRQQLSNAKRLSRHHLRPATRANSDAFLHRRFVLQEQFRITYLGTRMTISLR
jgi:hypothetical protein